MSAAAPHPAPQRPAAPAHGSALRGPQLTLIAITTLLLSFLAWAAVFQIDELVRADGHLIPPQQVQSVQSAEGGIVASVLVGDGDVVRAGQVLLRLDRDSAQADLLEIQRQYLAGLATHARLQAQLQERPLRFPPALDAHDDIRRLERAALEAGRAELATTLATLDHRIAQRRQMLQRVQAELRQREAEARLRGEELDILRPLVPTVISRAEWLSREQEWIALQGTLEGLGHQISEARSGLEELQAERARVLAAHRLKLIQEDGEQQSLLVMRAARLKERLAQMERTEAIAPVDGVVKQLHARAAGQVVAAGASLLDLVPSSGQLLVEARLAPANVGFVAPGQAVKIKVATYDFAIYGAMDGVVETISADALADRQNPQAPPYYRLTVAVREPLRDQAGRALTLTPGMTVSLDIVTGRRSVLAYLTKPLVRGMNQAMGER